ncbi:MAG: TonB-dependent receptor [Bacteroidia bacterium]|nr:TonB-dependent receptor [Bacteroidia bacterium]
MHLRSALLWLLFLLPALSFSQNSTVKGLLLDNDTRTPLTDVRVILRGSSTFSAQSGSLGDFEIKNVPYGSYTLEVQAENYEVISKSIEVNSAVTDAGTLGAQIIDNSPLQLQENLPTVTMSETDLRESSSQSVAGVLTAGRDPFAAAAAFNFSAARFRNRGYDNENMTLMNGIPVEDLSSSRTLFGTWAGLNDVTRSRESTYGLSASNYSYGSLDGSFSIDARASRQRKQFALSYANSNRTYNNRLMASYGTGLLNGGWAFAASVSRRWGDEGYVPGTFTDGWSWFASVEKRFGTRHSLSLTHMGANTMNGRANPAIQEAYDLAGSNYYNPNWGYQNGKVRNARIGRQQQPLTILSHEWKINSRSELETSLGYQYGSTSLSGFDWFNATDPRPDFYRRLPSYINDPALRDQAEALWRNNEAYRQVNWENIYNVNRNSFETVQDANGIAGNTISGRRSRYIIEERVTDNKRVSFAMNYNHVISDHFTLNSGYNYQFQESENYKRVNDLLGGEFYVDLNQWAEQDFPDSSEALQNNLETPNRILHEGDRFGYNYVSTVTRSMAWAQGQFKFSRVDFFAAFHVASTEFFRTGKFRNGIFANNSFGDSKKEHFNTFGIKGGATYKINGRNYLFLNGAYETRAPLFENVYVSPRTRNDAVANLEKEKITSFEGGYMLRAPRAKIRASLYYTQLNDGYNTVNFWHEDFRTFVNYSLSNMDRRHVGLEFGTELTLGQGWSSSFAAAVGQYYYTDRMNAVITQDNNATVLAENEIIYSKNFFVANGPQNAFMAGVMYRSKKFWMVNLSANYFSNNYVDFNPARRTVGGVDLLGDGNLRESIIDQQKADGQFTLDFFGTKSWRVSDFVNGFRRNTFLVLNLGVSNILDNQDMMLTGFEQLRFDYAEKNPNKFPPRYYYGFGRTYFASIIVRFN